jgi:hypothetical protein
VNALKDALQRAVACVTKEVLILTPGAYRPGDETHSLRFARGTVQLASANAFSLALEYQFRIERSAADSNIWEARQVAYYYYFDDLQGREIFAYHWHPHVEGMTYPHLHISPGAVRSAVIERAGLSEQANALRADLAAAHLPTGPIALERVLWLAIAQFGATPLRRDWRRLLPAPS